MEPKNTAFFRLFVVAALLLLGGRFLIRALSGQAPTPPQIVSFDGERAYNDVSYQTALGARVPGSEAHHEVVEWLVRSLTETGWKTEIQEGVMMGHPLKNVIARSGEGSPWIILGAHYDTRMVADNDPDPVRRGEPVPGANDGASGVAVLVELARVLPPYPNKEIWLVFFDLEDQGRIEGYDWILGSRYFAEQLTGKPDAVVILDMIGDADLNIYYERNSDPALTEQIWEHAASLGLSMQFIAEPKHSMLDDHTPFLEKGIPAVDVIDFDYPYWHTTQDTADKVSPKSLKAVGDTIQTWINTLD